MAINMQSLKAICEKGKPEDRIEVNRRWLQEVYKELSAARKAETRKHFDDTIGKASERLWGFGRGL